jgi:long-chain acyl-CoA synthetase
VQPALLTRHLRAEGAVILVQHFLEHSAERAPGKLALVCGGRRLAFGELDRLAAQAAAALRSLGLRPGDRAVVHLENSVEAVVALFGIWKAGGVAVPLHPEVRERKLELVLNDCRATVLISGAGCGRRLRERCPDLAAVLATGEAGEGALPFAEVVARAPAARLDRMADGTADEHDLCLLIYTSGSTGRPRGVMLTHRNVAAASASIIEYLGNTADDVVVVLLPLSFDYGLYNLLMPLRFGGTVVLERGFAHPGQLVGLLRREGVTGLPLVPAIAAWFAKLRSFAGCDLPALRYITSTGQALPVPHLLRLAELFPRARIFSMYGLTECKRVSYLPPEEIPRRPGSVGKAMPDTETWLVDPQGEPIPATAATTESGVVGELVVRGENVMRGYWNLPAETALALRPGPLPGERVLYTGDLFRQDGEGFLDFVARRDDLIKTGGLRVSPKEVESVVQELDGVAEAAVCGVPDEVLGEAVKLVVTLREGCALDAAEIRAHCARQLEKHMVPRHVEVRGELPRTATGKTARRELRAV